MVIFSPLIYFADMKFEAVVTLHGKTATGIEVPAEIVEGLGGGKRAKVVATINDYSYRTSVAPYSGVYFIPLAAENRNAAGVQAGERVTVELVPDTEPRIVEVPEDLKSALDASPGARQRFETLSYSHQREHVQAINSAKAEETRRRRIAKAVQALSE